MKNFAAIFLLLVLVLGVVYFLDKNYEKNDQQNNNQTEANLNQADLKIEDLKQGTGEEVKSGQTVSVHYAGTLTNGVKFDSSYERNEPFEFKIGEGLVIQGWEQGLIGMKVGGKRKLTIPPSLAYGERAIGSIPANSTLIFEIELLAVK